MGVNYSGSYAAPRMDLGVAFMEASATMNRDKFIAPQVLPTFRTNRKAATFTGTTRESILQDKDAQRAARSGYNRINTEGVDISYDCPEYGLEHVVDDSERSLYENDFDADAVAAEVLAHAVLLQMEKRAHSAIFNTTTWTGASLYTDNSSAPWDSASTDAIGQVLAAAELVRQNCGMKPNALILSEIQAKNLTLNTAIINRFPGAALITLEMLRQAIASIFGVQRLIVAGGVRNSAIEGQTYSGADIWSDDYAMLAVIADQGAPLPTPCVGRTMLWVPDSPLEIVMEQYREEQSRGDVFRARHSVDELVIDANFGHLMKVDA